MDFGHDHLKKDANVIEGDEPSREGGVHISSGPFRIQITDAGNWCRSQVVPASSGRHQIRPLGRLNCGAPVSRSLVNSKKRDSVTPQIQFTYFFSTFYRSLLLCRARPPS